MATPIYIRYRGGVIKFSNLGYGLFNFSGLLDNLQSYLLVRAGGKSASWDSLIYCDEYGMILHEFTDAKEIRSKRWEWFKKRLWRRFVCEDSI